MASFLSEKMLLRGKCRELFNIRLAGGQQSGDDFASALGHDIAMRAANFAQQAVRSQQPQLACDAGGSPPFFFVRSDFGPELPPHVPIAQAVDHILTPADRREQGRVFFTPRVEGTMAASIFDHGAADAGAGLARRGFARNRRGCLIAIPTLPSKRADVSEPACFFMCPGRSVCLHSHQYPLSGG